VDDKRIAVIGAGNSGYAVAGHMALAGYRVNLYGSKERGNVDPVIKRGGIEVLGEKVKGFAKLGRVTTDLAEAIADAKLILITYQSPGHEELARNIATHLQDGQIIVLIPGNLGSISFARILKEKGVDKDIKIAETRMAMYGSRRVAGEATVRIMDFIENHIAAFPARDTDSVFDELKELYPTNLLPAKNVMEVALSNLNFQHVPWLILNTGTVENPNRPFYIYGEDCTPSVQKVAEATKRENSAIIKRLGLIDLSIAMEERMAKNRPPELKKVRGPKDMRHRNILEDCPFGLVIRASLGDMIGVPTPVTKALITLASEIIGVDFFTKGRTMERLGISGMSAEELDKFLTNGEI